MSKKETAKKAIHSEKDTSANVILIALVIVILCGIFGYFLYHFSAKDIGQTEVSYRY